MPKSPNSEPLGGKSEESPRPTARKRRSLRAVHEYVDGILAGDRVLLGQAITIVESHLERHREMARQIIEACLPHANRSLRIGITGTPGVGKSTFIESFGQALLEKGHRIAVLAIDPSSQLSRGSILGDKTRMSKLSIDTNAFIRPSPAGRSLGGVARNTRETIILCEAAGYDLLFVETVGVGQSEIAVHSMVDYFLLLLLPGAGDELQGIKRGIVEMADGILINKADGDRLSLARQAKKDYSRALHLFPPKASGQAVEVLLASALEGKGMVETWDSIQAYAQQAKESGYFEQRRSEQALYWLQESIVGRLLDALKEHEAVQKMKPQIEEAVQNGRMSPFEGAERLLNLFNKSSK
ncbi:MAG: methylmalonyl Co-A mutase-associated GTPase MeaB [Bacteroidota bacterium]